MIYRWKRSVKWRMEEGRILVCDCRKTTCFEIPPVYEAPCRRLDEGMSGAAATELVADLVSLDLLEELPPA